MVSAMEPSEKQSGNQLFHLWNLKGSLPPRSSFFSDSKISLQDELPDKLSLKSWNLKTLESISFKNKNHLESNGTCDA